MSLTENCNDNIHICCFESCKTVTAIVTKMEEAMKLLAIVIMLVAAASYPTQGAEIFQQQCQNYHEEMVKISAIRHRCGLPAFTDCCQPKSFFPATSRTGIYEISDVCNHETRAFLKIPSEKMSVRCDMDTDDGGWMVIQRRVNGGTTDFYLDWEAYEQGFGDLGGEFWLGLLSIHCLTTREEVELRIDMQTTSAAKHTWTYQEFRVDGPEDNYRLHISQGEGTTGSFDAMAYQNNWPFSTRDRDNDGRSGNCAVSYPGGWWYNNCFHTNLNAVHGTYFLWWITSSASSYRLSSVEMKVRAKACKIG